MPYFKAKTSRGVVFNAPLEEKADYQRAINFLQKEMEITFLEPEQKQAVKKPIQKKNESLEMKNFLEGVKGNV